MFFSPVNFCQILKRHEEGLLLLLLLSLSFFSLQGRPRYTHLASNFKIQNSLMYCVFASLREVKVFPALTRDAVVLPCCDGAFWIAHVFFPPFLMQFLLPQYFTTPRTEGASYGLFKLWMEQSCFEKQRTLMVCFIESNSFLRILVNNKKH